MAFFNINKISVNPFFFAVLAFFVLIDDSGYILLIIGAALLHEGAHVLSMLFFGVKINEIRFMPFGIKIETRQNININYKKEGLIALSGPIMNLLIAIFMFIFGQFFTVPSGFGFFFIANLSLFAINILPITPLDGGRALNSFLLLKFDIIKAERISLRISAILIIPLFIAGFYFLAITGYNFTLILISIYLLVCLYRKNKDSYNGKG